MPHLKKEQEMILIETNALKKEILKKIHEIGQYLILYEDKNSISLFKGNIGISLFLFYYSQFCGDDKFYNKAQKLIEKSFEIVQNGVNYQTFAGGLAGLGWFIEHLSQNNFLEVDTNEIIGDLDDFLYKYMLDEIKKGKYDYLHKAGGIALYFLLRKTNPKSKKYLEEYVDCLAEHSEVDQTSIKWKSEIIVADKEPIKGFNLSLSHGMSSIIGILSKILKRGINKDKTDKLLRGAIDYILSNQFDIKNSLSYFPNSISLHGDKGAASRLAWCYGDLGISVALWNASKALNSKELEQKSIEILLHSTKRKDLIENNIIGTGLCHGTAGIGHIFNRMFINARNKEFKEAAEYWFKKTLKLAKFEDGLAGYKTWRTEKLGGWTNDYSFLEGISGIGLAMISYVSDIEPVWDECLLLS